MSEEVITKILSVDIKVKTSCGKKTISLTDFVNELGVLSIRPSYDPYLDKTKYVIELEVECDNYSMKY